MGTVSLAYMRHSKPPPQSVSLLDCSVLMFMSWAYATGLALMFIFEYSVCRSDGASKE